MCVRLVAFCVRDMSIFFFKWMSGISARMSELITGFGVRSFALVCRGKLTE